MRCRDGVFVHWRTAPDSLEAHLPTGLAPATRDGDAWLSVVGVTVERARPRGSPTGPSFAQVNLRTYVRRTNGGENATGRAADGGDADRDRAVYFFSLDAADPVAVCAARELFSLPYYRSDVRLRSERGAMRAACDRRDADASPAHFVADVRPAADAEAVESADDGSLADFLAENYRFYVEREGSLYRGRIAHAPWRLRGADVDVRANTLFDAAGLERPAADPTGHVAGPRDVAMGRLRRVD